MIAACFGRLTGFAKAALMLGATFTGVAAAHKVVDQFEGTAPHVAQYDASVEDQALKAFEKRHPECLLWSDWKKLCSHAGPGGTATCRLDPLHPVAPSQPFCSIAKSSIGTQRLEREPGEQESINRFLIGYEANSNNPEYDPNRPFNGRIIAEMVHPACRVWSDGHKVICAQHGKGAPACSNASIKKLVFDRPLACVEWNPESACKIPRAPPRAKDAPPMILSDVYRLLRQSPAWGLYCDR